MRVKCDPQLYLSWSSPSSSKVVREYESRYHRISAILDDNPEILSRVDRDLKKLSRKSTETTAGRRATYTSENLLRALIVQRLEGLSLRDTEIRISHSTFLQEFVRLGWRSVMDYSLLDRAFNAVKPKTWKRVNEILTNIAVEGELIDPSTLRVDTTVVESNIHYPTDSSLMWDSWRTLYRLLTQARETVPGCLENRFHRRKAKSLHLFITRYWSSSSKKRRRKVLRKCRKFIAQVERIWDIALRFSESLPCDAPFELVGIVNEIKGFLPTIRQVISVAERVWLNGEVVPAKERIFSIFEAHTELIKRGRRHKPVEFGHMILLGQTREKFITQYDVMEKKIPDCDLTDQILDRHEETFGAPPDMLAADTGFGPKKEKFEALRDRVKFLAIPQRQRDYADRDFVLCQHFRAGIEGSISVLKRAFGLLRSPYRGFKNFVSHVGLGVFCHNLVRLAGT